MRVVSRDHDAPPDAGLPSNDVPVGGLGLPRRRRRRARWLAIAALVIGGAVAATVLIGRAASSLPTVDRDTIYLGTVERGPLELTVQGPGTLVPEQIRWISAPQAGRVVRIAVQPGALVTADTVLLELSNPDAELAALDADRQVAAARVALTTLSASLDGQVLAQESAVQSLDSDRAMAAHRAAIDADMRAKGVVAALDADESSGKAEQLGGRVAFEQKRLGALRRGTAAQIQAAKDEIARLEQLAAFRHRQVDELTLRAGVDGVLQELPLQVGQSVAAGAPCAKVVDPHRLKAVLRVPEIVAKDVAIGQHATIDLRSTAKLDGTVARVDPAAQNGTVSIDVALPQPLPRDARPDLNVDGVVTLDRTGDVLHVGRPALGEAHATTTAWKLVGDDAVRVPVTYGRASSKDIEIVGGLAAGDRIILSDMSRFDGRDRVRVK